MQPLNVFELPKLHVLVHSGRYVAHRTSTGYVLRPADPESREPSYRVEVEPHEERMVLARPRRRPA